MNSIIKRQLCDEVLDYFSEISKDLHVCQIPNCRSEPFKGGITELIYTN